MKLEIPQTLKDLSQIFKDSNSKLYIIGGFVRNALLGFCETDLDICGPMRFDLVQKMLRGTEFSSKLINKKLGTLHIKSKITNEEFEYTTFRKESYNVGGNHTPEKISFVKDIKKDVKRRDFSCNAIYYDIEKEELLDFCGGVKDTLEHVLKTVDVPTKTFDDDGLRILRLVRMSSELDFDIDRDTFDGAKQKISNLSDISQQRFNKEIFAILFSDYKYESIKNSYCPTKGIKTLCQLGAFGYIFRQISFEMGIEDVNKKLQKPWLNFFGQAPVVHRLSVFCYEFLNALGKGINKKNIENVLGENGLVLSKKEVLLQIKLLCGIEQLKNLKSEEIPRFVQKNYDIIKRMLELGRIFNVGDKARDVLRILEEDGVPMRVSDLKITGFDLINNFPNVPKTRYNKIFEDLLFQCLILPEMNTKQNLIHYLKGKLK